MIIDGTDITMVRGDSESITVSCKNPDGSVHPFEAGDMVYFTVKKDAYREETILQKIATDFTDGRAMMMIDPEDTRRLDFDVYKYDVQLTTASGRVTTIIPMSNFRATEEITYD